jgi:hypothetical protein
MILQRIPPCLLAGLLLSQVGGCLSKKVSVTFTNLSTRTVDVDLRGPGEGTGVVGTLRGGNSRIQANLKVERLALPAQYNWTAGPYDGRFTLTSKSPDDLYIDVGKNEPVGTTGD